MRSSTCAHARHGIISSLFTLRCITRVGGLTHHAIVLRHEQWSTRVLHIYAGWFDNCHASMSHVQRCRLHMSNARKDGICKMGRKCLMDKFTQVVLDSGYCLLGWAGLSASHTPTTLARSRGNFAFDNESTTGTHLKRPPTAARTELNCTQCIRQDRSYQARLPGIEFATSKAGASLHLRSGA